MSERACPIEAELLRRIAAQEASGRSVIGLTAPDRVEAAQRLEREGLLRCTGEDVGIAYFRRGPKLGRTTTNQREA